MNTHTKLTYRPTYNTITTLEHVVEFRELILTANETTYADGFQYTASKRYE